MRAVLIAVIVALLVVTATFSGCTQAEASEASLKLGVVASMTGPASSSGTDVWQGAQLAADELNADGGVFVKSLDKNVTVELVQGDDESTREGGQKAVTKMITDDRVDLLVGGFSSAVVTAHQAIVAEHRVPYIITGASSSTVTHRTDIDTSTMFHHDPLTEDFAGLTTTFVNEVMRPAVNAKFGYPSGRPFRMAVIYQDSPFGKGVLAGVNDTITKNNLPIELVAQEPYKMGETDYRTILTSVKAKRPDVVYSAAFLNEQVPMITQARRDVGLNTLFFAVECCEDPDYYAGLGQYGEYSGMDNRFSTFTVPRGPISVNIERFRNAYRARFGEYPTDMAAATYEGVYIAAAAVGEAGTLDKAKVTETLAVIAVPEMVQSMTGGEISFANQFHESKTKLFMVQAAWDEAENGLRPKIVWPAELKEAEFQLPDWYVPGGS